MKNKRLSESANLSIQQEFTVMCTKDRTFKENVTYLCKVTGCGANLQENIRVCIKPM